MVARIAPLAVVVLVLVVACYDDPLEVLRPDGARPSHTSETPSGSGIFDGAESFVAGNPMRNFAGGAPYNYGYYSDGPDPGDGWNDSDQARIAIPHDSLLVDLSNFSFETWVRISYSSEWEYGLIALNSNHQTNSTGQLDLGYFLLEYLQYSPGVMEFTWGVSSYHESFGGDWSFIYAEPPPLDPDSGRVMHVVGLHDANVISLYIDGSLAATADISFRQDLSDIFSWGGDIEKPLMIAGSQCAQDDPSCNVSLAGSIGESAFYRRALTPTEIQEHYQVGTGTAPTEPDSLNDPYRDLVLSHQPDGYWRHRESELHGLGSIEGEQVVDASGNGWHGTYAGGGPADELVVVLSLARDSVGPVLGNCFDAVAQTARDECSKDINSSRTDTVRLTVRAEYQPSGQSAAGAELRLSAQPLEGSGGHVYNHGDRPTGTFFLPTENSDSASGGERGEMLLTLSDSGSSGPLIYRTSGVSGIEVLSAEVSHEATAGSVSDSVTIRYPGLVAWDRQDTLYYFKEQDTTQHAQRHGNINHFSVNGLKEPLLAVFAEFRETFSDTAKFKITDMSLSWGGLLDIDSTAWSNPHQRHREGRNADVGLDNMSETNRQQRFRNMCSSVGLYCVKEGNHIHVNYCG